MAGPMDLAPWGEPGRALEPSARPGTPQGNKMPMLASKTMLRSPPQVEQKIKKIDAKNQQIFKTHFY